MSQSKNPDQIEDQAEQLIDRDSFGQLTRRGWSCLILDVADKLGPTLGREGMELYFRMAQASEAYSTGWEGQEEENSKAIINDFYVGLSLDEYLDTNTKWNAVVERPPYPIEVPWEIVDAGFSITVESDVNWIPYRWDIHVYVIRQIQGKPEYGTEKVVVGSWITTDKACGEYFYSLVAATPEDRMEIANELMENRFTRCYVRRSS